MSSTPARLLGGRFGKTPQGIIAAKSNDNMLIADYVVDAYETNACELNPTIGDNSNIIGD